MSIERRRSSGMDHYFGRGVAFGHIDDALAPFASQTAVLPNQRPTLRFVSRSLLPPPVPAIARGEDRDEESGGGDELEGFGCLVYSRF
jgi:hypothetical protein